MRYHFRKIVTLIKNKLYAQLLHVKCSANYYAIHSFIQPVFPHKLIRNAHDPSPDIKAMFMFLSSTITLPDSASVHIYNYGDFSAIAYEDILEGGTFRLPPLFFLTPFP